ncbi:MAG: outer membrane beta-barrel protein [Azoarcus sp.]|nr:outer membrane beta-barrel protein [Azoarcus sp.]
MKKKLAFLLLAASPLIPASALAAGGGIYVKPKVMYESGSAEHRNANFDDSAFGFGVAVGWDLRQKVKWGPVSPRFEVELATSGEKSDRASRGGLNHYNYKTKWSTTSLFVNGYADFHNSTPITPYVGLGIGSAYTSHKVEGNDHYHNYWFSRKEDAIQFAYNIGLGAAFRITNTVGLDLNYRYANFGDINRGTVDAHQFLLGARFNF